MGRVKIRPAKPLPKPRPAELAPSQSEKPTRRLGGRLAALIAAVVVVSVIAILLLQWKRPQPAGMTVLKTPPAHDPLTPRTLKELLVLTPDQLAKVDLARANLLCAEGLPGSEGLDVDACCAQLDGWARWIAEETQRNFHQLLERPEEFEHGSEAYYRMIMLITVLQQDYKVRYDPKLIG